MTVKPSPAWELPDTSDLDRFVGQPVGGVQYNAPIATRDIRRFVQAMGNPNPLHWDDDFAAKSVFGRIVAPQSMTFGANTRPEGRIPGSHSVVAGSETWFYGPRLFPGQGIQIDRMILDYEVKETRFGGPTVFARSDATVVNSAGEFIFKRRNTRARYLIANAALTGGISAEATEREWISTELAEFEARRAAYAEDVSHHTTRLYPNVALDEELPGHLHGPHTAVGFALGAAAGLDAWGDVSDNLSLPSSEDFGMIGALTIDPDAARRNPAAANAQLQGGAHIDAKLGDSVKYAPGRVYGYADSIAVWVIDYVANWAGESSFIRHLTVRHLYPVLSGDMTFISGRVEEKWRNPRSDDGTVRIRYELRNQDDRVQAQGAVDVELPDA